MAPNEQGALAPVQGALVKYLDDMRELHTDHMPEVVAHEYVRCCCGDYCHLYLKQYLYILYI